MFFLNSRNQILHWFCGKRTFIDGDVYIPLNGGVGSRLTSSLLEEFCFFWCQCVVG